MHEQRPTHLAFMQSGISTPDFLGFRAKIIISNPDSENFLPHFDVGPSFKDFKEEGKETSTVHPTCIDDIDRSGTSMLTNSFFCVWMLTNSKGLILIRIKKREGKETYRPPDMHWRH
jgi:hypothetical protein